MCGQAEGVLPGSWDWIADPGSFGVAPSAQPAGGPGSQAPHRHHLLRVSVYLSVGMSPRSRAQGTRGEQAPRRKGVKGIRCQAPGSRPCAEVPTGDSGLRAPPCCGCCVPPSEKKTQKKPTLARTEAARRPLRHTLPGRDGQDPGFGDAAGGRTDGRGGPEHGPPAVPGCSRCSRQWRRARPGRRRAGADTSDRRRVRCSGRLSPRRAV